MVCKCTDMLKTLCSPAKVKSLLSTAKSSGDSPTAVHKVTSWTKAVSAAVTKLKEDFSSFPDIVEPFVAAVQMVCTNKINLWEH